MSRRALTRSLVSAGWVLAAACGLVSPEEQTLLRFFEAARTLDRTEIAKYATVGFNPRSEGVVQTFTVTAIGPEREAAKDITIEAIVRDPDGTTVRRGLRVTLQKTETRWIITGLQPIPASQTSRAASSGRPS